MVMRVKNMRIQTFLGSCLTMEYSLVQKNEVMVTNIQYFYYSVFFTNISRVALEYNVSNKNSQLNEEYK